MQLTWSSLLQTELAGRQNLSKSITSTCSPRNQCQRIQRRCLNEGFVFSFSRLILCGSKYFLHTMCPWRIVSFWWKFARKSKYSARPQLLLVFMFLRNIWIRDSLLFVQSDCTSLTKIWKPVQIPQITNTIKSPIPAGTEMTGSHIRQFWPNQDPSNKSRSWSDSVRMYPNKWTDRHWSWWKLIWST